jgi:hypothetical protein
VLVGLAAVVGGEAVVGGASVDVVLVGVVLVGVVPVLASPPPPHAPSISPAKTINAPFLMGRP